MLRRFHVQGFKSLLDVEVELAPLVVLFGPNAVGKSNVLESLLLLSRLATEQTLARALDPLRGHPLEAFSLPEGGLEGLLSQKTADLEVEADFETRKPDKKTQKYLRYGCQVRIHTGTGAAEVADESLIRLKKNLQPIKAVKPRIERQDGELLVRQLGGQGHPRHEPVGLNHTLVSNQQFSGETRYPDFDQLRRELGAWRMYYLDPRVGMREPQGPREVQDIGPRGEWIAPFLYRLKGSERHRKNFLAIRRALRSTIPTIQSLDVDLDPKRGTLDIQIQQDGTPYSSRVISEGTLRVLALCCIAANPWPSELIAFEEPENGVQPRRIEVIADLLLSMASQGTTQVIVTTHSPTFLGAMTRRGREKPGQILLLRCSQDGRATQVAPVDPLPLFQDDEFRKALVGREDEGVLEAAMLRGWLDG